MKTTTKFWKLLPVAAAALALGGCGGGGSDDSSDTQGDGKSIVDCFTANKTVSFSVTHTNVPTNSIPSTRSTTGPMTYNGQTVTGQKFFYPSGNLTYTTSRYWTVTNSGVTFIAEVDYTGAESPDKTFFPQNMNPGQTATSFSNDISTFVGFETVILAGKTFSTCHFKGVDPQGNQAEGWYAPEYGQIKVIEADGATTQYSGDL